MHQLPEIGRGPAAERERAAQAQRRARRRVLIDARPGPGLRAVRPVGPDRHRLGRHARGPQHARGQRAAGHRAGAASASWCMSTAAEEVARARSGERGTVVCVSDAVADWARSVGARPDAVTVDAQRGRPDRIGVSAVPVTPADGADFTVGFVGTLKPWHGLEILVEAAHPADGGRPDVAPAAGRRRTAGPAISTTGWPPRVWPIGPSSPVPSRRPTFGPTCTGWTSPAPRTRPMAGYFSPLKVYEYLAAGLPVVASAVGQLPTALDHGASGDWCRPATSTALRSGARRRPRGRSGRAHRRIRAARRRSPGTPGAPSSSRWRSPPAAGEGRLMGRPSTLTGAWPGLKATARPVPAHIASSVDCSCWA